MERAGLLRIRNRGKMGDGRWGGQGVLVERRLGMQPGFGRSGQQEIPEVGMAQGFKRQLQSVLRNYSCNLPAPAGPL